MRLAAIVLALAFALLANPAWCLGTCCPAAKAAGPSTGTLSAPECCSPAGSTSACPPSLHRDAGPAIALTGAYEGNPAISTPEAPFAKFTQTARFASSTSPSPPGQHAPAALHVQLLI